MENKNFAYMKISTNHKTQKVERQKQTIIEYSVNNGFKIDEFVSDVITGGTKADNRPNYHNMKKQLRSGDTLIISDVEFTTAMSVIYRAQTGKGITETWLDDLGVPTYTVDKETGIMNWKMLTFQKQKKK